MPQAKSFPRRAGLVVVATAVTVAFSAVPSHAAAASAVSCRAASTASGAKIVDRSRLAVVFRRGARFYGCVYGSTTVRRYSNLCCQNVRVDVAGRYMAYTYEGTAIGDDANKLGVYNLKTGVLIKIAKLDPTSEGGGREIDTGAYVPDFLVTDTGALAWLRMTGTDQYELRVGDGSPRAERIVDSGTIGARSLRRSDGGRSVAYTKDGVTKTAQLRS